MNTGSMSAKTACDVAVIGGGAAGMMAALQAAWAGARVALLEKNEKLGKKIYITGKGRCNVTNVADIDDFFKQIPRNPRFLNAAARQFTHEDVTGLLEMLGTPTKVERGGRVFPESDKASDVTRALDRGMRHTARQERDRRDRRRELSFNGQHGRRLSVRQRKRAECHQAERVVGRPDDG